jgi:tRNA 2-thiouridine synthesizing protein A
MLLDLRGLNCPLPALRTRKMLRRLAYADRLSVECTDPLAAIDIPHLLHETGDTLERQEAANGLFIFRIERGKAWEQHFFARGPPMRQGPGAVDASHYPRTS